MNDHRGKILWLAYSEFRYLFRLMLTPAAVLEPPYGEDRIRLREPLPADAEVHSVWPDQNRQSIGVLIHSAEYPEVPQGSEYPALLVDREMIWHPRPDTPPLTT